MTNYLVEAESLFLNFGTKVILENITFKIQQGEFVYLTGRTGSGKSTLLRSLYADVPVHKGSLRIGKYQLQNLPHAQYPYLRRTLGVVFQDFQLLPDRSVAENIAFVMRAIGINKTAEIKARVTEVLMQVGLASRANNYPHQLSGGEQQRTALARALVNNPLLIIADEPTGNLDPEVTDYLMKLIREINQKGTTIIMATHEISLIQRYPARVLTCEAGKLFETQPKFI